MRKNIEIKGLVTNYREGGCKTGGGGGRSCEVLPLQKEEGGGGRKKFKPC